MKEQEPDPPSAPVRFVRLDIHFAGDGRSPRITVPRPHDATQERATDDDDTIERGDQNMSRKQNVEVFNDFVYATAINNVWTDAKFNDILARFDETSIIAVADSVGGTGTIQLSVQMQHSGDGRNWVNKNTNPEINAQTITVGATTTLAGSDAGTTPSGGFVRLTVWLPGGTTPSAHVRIYVCNRDQA